MTLRFFAPIVLIVICLSQTLCAQKDVELINSGEILKAGLKLHDDGKYNQAIGMYELIGRNDTNYTKACYEEAYTAYTIGNYDTVFRLCKILMSMDDYMGAEAYTLYGSALDEKEKSAEAIEFYNSALVKFPRSYLLYFNLGVAYYRAGKHDEALRSFKRALEINPRHPTSHYFIGLLLADNKRWAPAMLALNTALLLNPNRTIEGNCLNVLLNISKGDYTPVKETGKLSEPEDPNFAKIDKLIDSKVALNAGYEVAAKVDDKLMKQNQFLLETMKKTRPVSDDYFVKQYVPLYTELLATQNLKTFDFYPYKDIDNELVNKWKAKNKKEVQEYETWIAGYFDKISSEFIDTINSKVQKFQRFAYMGGTIQALGTEYDAKTKIKKGYWRYFYSNSNVETEGSYDNSGKEQGEWKSYYGNGKLNTVVSFKDGKMQGQLKEYYVNGNVKRDAIYKDGLYNGKVLLYYSNGALKSETDYTNGITNGKVRTYYQNASPNLDIDAKNDKIEGKVIQYDDHGYVSMVSDAKNGEKNGQYITYYANGNVKAQGIIKDGKGEGKWVYYDEKGNKTKETQYVKGDEVGNVKEFFANGKVSTDQTYDTRGKLTGLVTDYDDDGIKYFEGIYKDDKLTSYKYLDKTGKVIHEASEAHGELEFKAYTVNGKLIREGLMRKGDRQGKWTYYYRNGTVRLTENYEAGLLSGKFQEFYKSGVKHKEGNYKNGKLQGDYRTYFENGKLQEEFILVDGMRQGDDYTYFMNDSIAQHSYYVDGDEEGWQACYFPNGKLNYEFYDDPTFLSKYVVYDTTGKVSSTYLNPKGTAVYDIKFFNGKPKAYGNYVNGHLEGDYKYYYGNGKLDGECTYKFGYRNGPAKEHHENGKPKEDEWYKNGEADSLWIFYNREGVKESSGTYSDGERNGYWRWFYPNGKTEYLALYKQEDKDSTIVMYAPDGTVRIKLKFDEGELLSYTYVGKDGKDVPDIKLQNESGSVTGYYPNGQKSYEAIYKNGWREGKCTYYYPDGKLQWEENFEHGDKTGKQTYYWPDGKLQKEQTEYYDELDGPSKYYDESGNLILEENYVMGYLNGFIKQYEGGKVKKQSNYYYGVEL